MTQAQAPNCIKIAEFTSLSSQLQSWLQLEQYQTCLLEHVLGVVNLGWFISPSLEIHYEIRLRRASPPQTSMSHHRGHSFAF